MIRGLGRISARLVDRALLRPDRPIARRWLARRIAVDATARAHLDRACVALRVLEDRQETWSTAEAALCEATIFASLGLDGGLASHGVNAREIDDSPAQSWSGHRWIAGLLLVVAALAVVIARPWWAAIPAAVDSPAGSLPRGLGGTGVSGYWGTRGGMHDAGVAIEALCGDPLAPASEGCESDDRLALAYRVVDHRLDGAQIIWFGVDARGDALYYQPSPLDRQPIRMVAGDWQSMPFSIALSVQHVPGPVDIYVLAYAGDVPITVEDVDRWASALAGGSPPEPWHRAVRGAMGLRCILDDCASAHLRMFVRPSAPPRSPPPPDSP